MMNSHAKQTDSAIQNLMMAIIQYASKINQDAACAMTTSTIKIIPTDHSVIIPYPKQTTVVYVTKMAASIKIFILTLMNITKTWINAS
jgi:hypothetical protein